MSRLTHGPGCVKAPTIWASNGIEKPQCILCSVVLSAESMKPSKLKHHLETKHSQHAKKDVAFFQHHEAGLKHQRLKFTGSFNQSNVAAIEASYVVALEITKQKKQKNIQLEKHL